MNPDFLTLADAAQLIPGANVNTLKRRARQGKLTVYRTGRACAHGGQGDGVAVGDLLRGTD